MRKGFIYAGLLAAALLCPTNHVELAKMRPVETVSIRMVDGTVIIETDTEDAGTGSTVEEAMKDLADTTAGRIYLDTANYLLVTPEACGQLSVIARQMKRNVRMCEQKGDVDLKKAGEFLQVHSPNVKLKCWQKGEELQILKEENGRLKFVKKSDENA